MKLQNLIDKKELIPTLAKWYFEEWGYEDENRTIEIERNNLEKSLNRGKIPITIIATNEGNLIGAGQLKWKEMSIYPAKEYWIGGILVRPQSRGGGTAKLIIKRLIEIAKTLQIKTLYLQTERLDGGLYSQLGWTEIEQINYHNTQVVVMKREI